MLKFAFVGVVVTLMALIWQPSSTEANEREVLSCFSGLKAVDEYIKSNQPEAKEDYIKSKYGWISLIITTSKEYPNLLLPKYSDLEAGSASGIRHCVPIGLSMEDFQLMQMLVHGVLPDDPFDELARCFAAFIGKFRPLDQKIGTDRSSKIAYIVGVSMGKIGHAIGEIYGIEVNAVTINDAANSHLASLSALDTQKEISKRLEEFTLSCGWFDIPLNETLEVVNIMTADPSTE